MRPRAPLSQGKSATPLCRRAVSLSPPVKALYALSSLSVDQAKLLRTCALLVLRLPALPRTVEGEFLWLVEPSPADSAAQDAIWYFDGSMLNGKWRPYRSTGFGIAVVTLEGDLIGNGEGTPPSWCSTAAAAEA